MLRQDLIGVLITVVALLIIIMFYTVAERKVMASIQRRRGPNVVGFWGVLQGLADGLKLLVKEVIVPQRANKDIYYLAPILTFSLGVTGWVVAPIDLYRAVNFMDSALGLLIVLALSSLGVYGIILSGWSSNSKYAFLGGLRSSAQMISYEIFFGTIILCVVLCAGSLSIKEMVKGQTSWWYVLPLFPMAVTFFIAMLAETNRAPFDLPEAEAEIVAGYNIEYSSMTFALFFLGEYGSMYFLSAMLSYMFLGGWLPPLFLAGLLPGSVWFILKASVVNFMFIFVRANFPRYRYDQLMAAGWKLFLPFTFAFLIFVAYSVQLGKGYFDKDALQFAADYAQPYLMNAKTLKHV